jgi:hypothetical protein
MTDILEPFQNLAYTHRRYVLRGLSILTAVSGDYARWQHARQPPLPRRPHHCRPRRHVRLYALSERGFDLLLAAYRKSLDPMVVKDLRQAAYGKDADGPDVNADCGS